MRLTIVAGILVALASFSARAADISIMENDVHKTISCEDQDVDVMGNDADLKLTGKCDRINVMGNSNKVSVETASRLAVSGNSNEVSAGTAKRIEVTGRKNRVTWANEVDGHAPKISNLGEKNTASRGSGSAAAPAREDEDEDDDDDDEDEHSTTTVGSALEKAQSALNIAGVTGSISDGDSLLINHAGVEKTYACDGKDVAINGANNKLTFTGECDDVAVNGSKNVVHLEAVEHIAANGTDNTVFWKRGTGKRDPKVLITGKRNKVSREK